MDIKLHKISDTGLYHHEVFLILTEYELARAKRYPSPITLLHISLKLEKDKPEILEKFKQVFAGIMNTGLRVSDIPAHLGEDFLVLLPMTDGAGGQAASERLITRLKGIHPLSEAAKFKYLIHIGIASLPAGQGISAQILMEQAAIALKKASEQGPEACVQYSG